MILDHLAPVPLMFWGVFRLDTFDTEFGSPNNPEQILGLNTPKWTIVQDQEPLSEQSFEVVSVSFQWD